MIKRLSFLPTSRTLRATLLKPQVMNQNQLLARPVTTLTSNGKALPKVYVSLGSNIGDRAGNIDRACDLMEEEEDIRILRTSSLWETEPMYLVDQARFLNAIVEVETNIQPHDLLRTFQMIEKVMGRVKLIDKGPRLIDIDIVKYGNEVVKSSNLEIPHPRAHEREFVLRPLSELCPAEPLNPEQPLLSVSKLLGMLPQSPITMTTVTPVARNLTLRALDPRRKTHIMGIINMTPDSFSGDGLVAGHSDVDSIAHVTSNLQALSSRFEELIDGGATFLDIGGQSTRPGAPCISDNEENARVAPALDAAHELAAVKAGNVALSIDTFLPTVGATAVEKGIHVLNDVSAGAMSQDKMLELAAQTRKTIVLMHMRGDPSTMSGLNQYDTAGHDRSSDVPNSVLEPPLTLETEAENAMITAIARELLARVTAAEAAGVRRWHIILDPGLGFAKSGPRQNLAVLRRLPELRAHPGLIGLPWLVGPSRKRFLAPFVRKTAINSASTGAAPHERIYATAAAVAAAIQSGADILRVHDVKAMAEVAAVSDAVWRS